MQCTVQDTATATSENQNSTLTLLVPSDLAWQPNGPNSNGGQGVLGGGGAGSRWRKSRANPVLGAFGTTFLGHASKELFQAP